MNKGGLVVKKQEMTKMWINDAFVPVTVVKVLPQEILRYKSKDKDGYVSVVVGTEKKELKDKTKGQKVSYGEVVEFEVDDSFVQNNQVGKVLDAALLEGVQTVNVTGNAKGKGFQGMVKKFHIKGGGASHGHKFTRTGGSKGNRKPRRTMKGHPHAGHMGTQRVTVQDVKVIDVLNRDKEQLLVLKGSLPGARNGVLRVVLA